MHRRLDIEVWSPTRLYYYSLQVFLCHSLQNISPPIHSAVEVTTATTKSGEEMTRYFVTVLLFDIKYRTCRAYHPLINVVL